jgi:hypothetical protein
MATTSHGIPPKRYLKAEELTEWVPFTLNTIRKKTSRHEIPFLKKGRRVIYDWEQITQWLHGEAVETST